MRQAIRRANVKWFSARQKSGRKRVSPQQIVALRLSEFAVLFRARYGKPELPNDDSGRDDIEPVIHHLASLRQPTRRARNWLELWAPWLTLKEQRHMIAEGIANARPWTADELAWRYRITNEERTMLALTTIGAVDHGKAARQKQRKAKAKARETQRRRAKGAKPRAEYEAAALTRTRPWEAEGTSRATWYRRRRQGETSPASEPARETTP